MGLFKRITGTAPLIQGTQPKLFQNLLLLILLLFEISLSLSIYIIKKNKNKNKKIFQTGISENQISGS